MTSNTEQIEGPTKSAPTRLMVGASGLLALLTASCCVLPIGLSLIGLGGTWLFMLGPFVEYRIEILAVVGVVLAWAWFRTWQRWKCASRKRATLFVLGFATISFLIAVSSPLWEEDAARAMFALWNRRPS